MLNRAAVPPSRSALFIKCSTFSKYPTSVTSASQNTRDRDQGGRGRGGRDRGERGGAAIAIKQTTAEEPIEISRMW